MKTSKKLLLVDDEDGIRRVLAISLADMGYDVKTAENGSDALEKFKQIEPDIVLTDIKMPVMGGIDLLKKIKQDNPDTEVIMITGHGDIDLAIQSLKYEATDFVTKPINDDVLEIALKRAEERITMRQKLREYTENLEKLVEEKSRKIVAAEKMASVGETVAGLSHSIKNIASGLKGGAFVLEKGIELDNKEYLNQGWEMLRGNVDKITRLSLDLLDYAKTAKMDFSLCDPNVPLQEVADLMTHRAASHGICLDVCTDKNLENVYVDSEAIHRCLLNLVSNAIDACREQGCMEKRIITLKILRTNNHGIQYQVEDTCCGMEKEVQENLFQRFFTTKGSKGTGIGLMLTKKIIDEHKGTISVKSEKGKGSVFNIHLPGIIPDPDRDLKQDQNKNPENG
ncbi:Two component system response regulator/histidine kinase [Desulfonema limicola]|uniref:histidine kinase n=1 Tax=Desulfonema limicola TaxID=45656 RepID=A0A975B735_9BACT|nr:response regulator [Desulfonema limicola]QTA80047.1 Two component system response regulator/histidine kinase [Desulfonema limicola]